MLYQLNLSEVFIDTKDLKKQNKIFKSQKLGGITSITFESKLENQTLVVILLQYLNFVWYNHFPKWYDYCSTIIDKANCRLTGLVILSLGLGDTTT